MSAILRVRDENGNVHDIPAIVGPPGPQGPPGPAGSGAGDMVATMYDPQSKRTDVFAYADSKASEAESNANKYTDEKLAEISVPGGGGDASDQIEDHNTDTTAHADIRAAIPTAVSQLANDSGYLTKETDPTVPAWAKAASKPSYTASEVGADASGSAAKALTDAKAYADQKLSTIPTPDVSGQIGTHNTAADAHADIRQIAHNAASLATSAKSEAEAASQNAEWAYDEAISKASIFYCYEDSTELWEIDEQMDNGNIVILDQYGTHIPMTFADYGVTYVFRLLDGDRVITATVDSDGWTVHEEEAGGVNGADGKDATINGVNALTISAGDGIEATMSGSTLNIKTKNVPIQCGGLAIDSNTTEEDKAKAVETLLSLGLSAGGTSGLKIKTGWYSGKNTYGADNPNTLTCNFKPRLLILVPYINAGMKGYNYSPMIAINSGGAGNGVTEIGPYDNGNAEDYGKWTANATTWGENFVSWYSDINAINQKNTGTWLYFILGE